MRLHQNIQLEFETWQSRIVLFKEFLTEVLSHPSTFWSRFVSSYQLDIDCDLNVNTKLYAINLRDNRQVWISREAVARGFISNNLDRTLEYLRLNDSHKYSGFLGVKPRRKNLLGWFLTGLNSQKLSENSTQDKIRVAYTFIEPVKNIRQVRAASNAEIRHGQVLLVGNNIQLLKSMQFENLSRWPAPMLLRQNGKGELLHSISTTKVDKAIFAGTAQNWFHFVIEVLTKIVSIESDKNLRVVLPSNLEETQYEAVRLVSGQEPLVSSMFESILVDNVFFCEDGIPSSIVDISHLGQELLQIRSRVLDQIKNVYDSSTRKKIFVMRKPGLGRPLQNRTEVKNLLISRGFDCVYPEDLSFSQQVQLFHRAEILVIESGAAMTNVLFCNEKTQVIELNPGDGSLGFWGQYTTSFNLDHHPLEGFRAISGEQGFSMSGFRVDIRSLEKSLSKI